MQSHATFARRALAAGLLLALAAPLAAADRVSGSCTYSDTTIAFRDGIVYQEPDPFDENVKLTVVELVNVSLDKAAIARADDKEDAVREQVWEADDGGKVQLEIDASNTVKGLHIATGGSSFSTSGSGIGSMKAGANDATRYAGRFTHEDERMKCDVDFDLAYGSLAAAAAAAPAGKPLPAGGGEPGKVFLRNLAASQKGDVDGMLATASKAQADEIRAQRNDPEFAAMLELMKAFVPKTAKVVGGRDFGDRAELDVEGTDADGGATKGLVKMVKEADGWKVEKSSFRSGG